MDPFDLLPPELWSLIFGNINHLKDIAVLSLTCKSFNTIIFDSIRELYYHDTLDMFTVKKFKFLTRISSPVYICSNLQIQYLTNLKLKEVNILCDYQTKITNIYKFIEENEQLDHFTIIRERNYDRYNLILIDNTLNINWLSTILIRTLNNLNNNHIKAIKLKSKYFDYIINTLDTSKYMLKIDRHTISYLNDYLTKPFEIDLSLVNHIEKYKDPCFLSHKIHYINRYITIKKFESNLEILKYNFPNATFNVVYDKTGFMEFLNRRYSNLSEKAMKTVEIVRKRHSMLDLSNKPYKVI